MEQMTSELRQLLERQVEIREAMRRPGGIRVTVERELFAIGEKLKKYHAAGAATAADPALAARRN
jgi:hypothetical protein